MIEAFELGEEFAMDIREKRIFPEQVEIIERFKGHFERIIRTRKNDWVGEYVYWQTKGWL
jgi:hypothetical protein